MFVNSKKTETKELKPEIDQATKMRLEAE